jgi:hypothetical protein
MRSWPALVLAPSLVLADQSVAYAFVGWSCAHQHTAAVDIVHLAFLAATLVIAFFAGRALTAAGGMAGGREGAPGDRRMMALVALLAALLSALVIVAMWVPHWALAPCMG